MVAKFLDGDRIFMEKKHPNSWMIHAAESCVPRHRWHGAERAWQLPGPRHERMERMLSRNQSDME